MRQETFQGKGWEIRKQKRKTCVAPFDLMSFKLGFHCSPFFILFSNSIWVIKRDNKKSIEPKTSVVKPDREKRLIHCHR